MAFVVGRLSASCRALNCPALGSPAEDIMNLSSAVSRMKLKESLLMIPRLRSGLRFVTLTLILVVWPIVVFSQTAPVSYTVRLDPQPASHMLHITIEIQDVAGPSIYVAMPAWSPGAYRIHDAWREVQEF